MTHRTSQFEKSQGEIPDREGDESSLGSVFAPSEDKSEPHITNKRRGRKLGQRLERLDGELTAQRAVEGGRGEPGAQILISKRGRDRGRDPFLDEMLPTVRGASTIFSGMCDFDSRY